MFQHLSICGVFFFFQTSTAFWDTPSVDTLVSHPHDPRRLQGIDLTGCDGITVLAGTTTTCAAVGIDQCDIFGGEMIAGTTQTGPFNIVDTTPRIGDSRVCLTAAVAAVAPIRAGTPMIAEIGGVRFYPGTYVHPSAVGIAANQNVYLDAQGDPNAVFIFKMGSALTTGAGCKIVLENNANPENVYWLLGSALTTGADNILVGTIMAGSAITIGHNNLICGDVIAQSSVTCGGVCNVGSGQVGCPITIRPSVPGVNGDPLIMGIQGQLFKFDGRNGAWYSAISAKSFQWNMKISQFEGCPVGSDTFCSGAAFTFFDSRKRKTRTIEINVVNEHHVDIGCGESANSCLGNGSLEILIDDKKIGSGDYKFEDGTGRVLAFNTFYQCSRKWYDFDVTPEPSAFSSFRNSRRLAAIPGVFDIVRDFQDTVVDKEVCTQWIEERQRLGDLFEQAGHWSTIIVKTEDVQFHIEYKQENQRCNAHSLDVWMSKVSPRMLDETWEGIIGETKAPANEKKDVYERDEILKFVDDGAYEVQNPFSTRCEGCIDK